MPAAVPVLAPQAVAQIDRPHMRSRVLSVLTSGGGRTATALRPQAAAPRRSLKCCVR